MSKAKPAQASAPASVWIEPVAGLFVNGVPHVAQAADADTAAYLIATGAFTEGIAPTDAEPDADAPADEPAADQAGTEPQE